MMACDDETIPLQGRIETVADDSDLQEVTMTALYTGEIPLKEVRAAFSRVKNGSLEKNE